MIDIKGIIAAPYTPLMENGDLNTDYVEIYYNHLRNNNIAGAFINGSTADFTSLTIAERNTMASRWCEVADSDFITMIHVGHTSLRECQSMAKHAGNCGANVISSLPPFYFKPSNIEMLVDFCADIAGVNPEIPFIYYHIPELTGVDFSMLDFLEIGKDKIPNLAGIKFTKHDLMEYKLTLDYNNGTNVLFGVDEIILSSLPMGATGWVGSTYSHAAPIYHQIINLFEQGKIKEAGKMQHAMMEFVKITASYGWGGASKYLLKFAGLECGPVRAPHKNLSDIEKINIEADLNNIGFFDLLKSQKFQSVE